MEPIKPSYRFGVLFDGSECAVKVLQKTLTIMADQDRLTTITVVEPNLNADNIDATVSAICGTRKHDCVLLDGEPNQSIKTVIKNYLIGQAEDDAYIDFTCVGNRGLNVGNAVDGDNYLGTVAQNMIAMKKLNVIFVP